MKTQQQRTAPTRFTIFKPPGYIYKLSKNSTKTNQNFQYETYFNSQYSLRKYHRTIPVSSQTELLHYEWRKQTTSPVVNIVYLELLNRKISGVASEVTFIEVNVYTEQIQKTLADMINLTLPEAIYVLKQCICAYQQLFFRFSAVSICKFYCGMNTQGKLKVWINNNFSLNCNIQHQKDKQQPYNEVVTDEPAIINKILHMVGLLGNPSCKFFFYGLDKQLSIKRFSFNNCLQYINSFVANTKSLYIPNNLTYMLPKKKFFGPDRFYVNFLSKTRFQPLNDQIKDTVSLTLNNTNSFKHFASFKRLDNKNSGQNQNQTYKKPNHINQKKFRFKRHYQQLPIKTFHHRFSSNLEKKPFTEENPNISKKQYKISLHTIAQKSKRNSVKSNEAFTVQEQNMTVQKQRPSFCLVPTFISKQYRGDHVKKDMKSNEKKTQKSQKLKTSFQIQCEQLRGYESLVSSKTGSSTLNRFRSTNKQDVLYRTLRPQKPQKLEKDVNLNKIRASDPVNNVRARSASANLKFGSAESYLTPKKLEHIKRNYNQKNIAKETVSSHYENISKGDRTSTNSISHEGTAKKRSFLTKTNYDSNTEDNEKNPSFCRMDFSSMSIDNKITNKNFDSQIFQGQKQETQRSLMSYKLGFEKIQQKLCCKQVEQENQTKSYNGSSLRNTQKIAEQLSKLQKKNEQTSSNNFSFGESSNRIIKRNLKDSVEENWDMIKEKNEQVLIKNQWKKTINNLGELEEMAVNQSIIDADCEVARKDKYADIRLEKLERLGKNMCFSIVNRADQGTYLPNSSLKNFDAE